MTVCTLCLYIVLLFISCRITFYELIGNNNNTQMAAIAPGP